MRKYDISTNLIRVIKNLYNKATSAVLFNSSVGNWFWTTVGVRRGCLLSPILFDIFLERIMTDTFEDHEKHCQQWRQNNHQSPLSWWHRWLSRRGRRTGKFSWASRQNLHSLRHGDQCRDDHADYKEHQRHEQGDLSKRTEAWDSHKLQVPGPCCIWRGLEPEILSRIAQATAEQ